MEKQFSRSKMLLGDQAMEKLARSRVAVFGIGGVGGYVVEALVRSGVGELDIIDNDTVALSNLNRQIIATMDTVGRNKVDVMTERILSINPGAVVHAHKCFYLPETAREFDFREYDYVVDAIDTVTGKIQLILQAREAGVPVISAMGAGNKLDPTRFEVADIYETSIDPLARVMRRELKKRGVDSLKVVYSKEKPVIPAEEIDPDSTGDMADTADKPIIPAEEIDPDSTGDMADTADKPIIPTGEIEPASVADMADAADIQKTEDIQGSKKGTAVQHVHQRRSTPGSLAFVPSVAGLIIAGEVVKDLAGIA